MTIRYEYTVSGDGAFPADMLRYDACWPRGQDDVSEAFPGGPRPRRGHRSVRMASHRAPTAARWASFGWLVTDQKQAKVL